jgi:hypothetical protein
VAAGKSTQIDGILWSQANVSVIDAPFQRRSDDAVIKR